MKKMIKISGDEERRLLDCVKVLNNVLARNSLPEVFFVYCGMTDMDINPSNSKSAYVVDIPDELLKTEFEKSVRELFPSCAPDVVVNENDSVINRSMFANFMCAPALAVAATRFYTNDYRFWETSDSSRYSGTGGKIRRLLENNDFSTDVMEQIRKNIDSCNIGVVMDFVRDYWEKRLERSKFVDEARAVLGLNDIPFRKIGLFAYAVFKPMHEFNRIK